MAHVCWTWLTLICVATFTSCVISLNIQTSWSEISAQQTLWYQTSEQQASQHQTLGHDTSKHQIFEHDILSFHSLKHKSSGHQNSRHENIGHPPSGIKNLEQKTLKDKTSWQKSSRRRKSAGCTAPLLLPALPFFVVWNHPTGGCQAHGVDLGFQKWGIVDNNHDSFIGQEIVLLYTLGQFPHYIKSTAYNGGIPQLGNLTSHLQQASNDIKRNIPSPSFSGLSVIDFEAWRPLYDLNYDALKIYKQKSLDLAKKRFPQYNSSQIVNEARKEFQAAAKAFMEITLQEASLARPGGRWGYYGYPRCWDSHCNTTTVKINNMLSWIYNISTGLYPSIYFSRGESVAGRTTRIHNIIHETLRMKAMWAPQDAAILPYSLCQENSYDLFNKADLSNSILQPANMGSSGVVLWGSSNYMKAKNECLVLQHYINTTLGPFVLNVTSFFANCSQQLCGGHGRCVEANYERYYQYHLKKRGDSSCLIPEDVLARRNKKLKAKPNKSHTSDIFRFHQEQFSPHWHMNPRLLMDDQRERSLSDFDDYVCKCFAGWSGIHCEISVTD